MKKHRFLIIAIALSILLHLLVFIFAPELKSEINPSDYLKKITKISIFHEPQSAPKQESAPTVPEPPKSSNSIKKRAPRNNGITESRNNDNNNAPRDNEITESRNHGNTGAPRREGELAVIPKAKNPKTPPYPESLEEEGIEGSVTLELLISKEGKVLKAKVIKSDHELFSESALKTVKNYKFSPGKLKDGSEVDSLIEFVIKFEISL